MGQSHPDLNGVYRKPCLARTAHSHVSKSVGRAGAPDSVLAQAVSQAPSGFHMHIEAEDRTSNYMPLSEPIITIGRGADNDMVLPTEGVSRHHARLQATRDGWAVVDLGGLMCSWSNHRFCRTKVLAGLFNLLLQLFDLAQTDQTFQTQRLRDVFGQFVLVDGLCPGP